MKETTRGTTPISPTLTAIPTKEYNPQINIENIKYRKLGGADLYKGIKVREMYDVSISYSPIDSLLLKSMINLTGTGNRDDTFSFTISQEHNNAGTLTEMFQILKGVGISSVTVSVKDGDLVMVESDWIASTLTQWATTGIAGASYAAALTATPWSAVTTGATPFTFNGVSYDVRNFSMTVNHNPDRVQVVGQSTTTWVTQTTREITIDVDIVYKDTTVQADVVTLTPRTATMQINSTGPTTLTFTELYLEKYDETVSADSTDAKVISYSGFAKSVSIA